MQTLNQTQYGSIKSLLLKLDAWIDTKRGKNGWASYRQEEKPASIPDVSNEERSAVEVFEFCHDVPDHYFLYIDEQKRTATTWTGDKLGDVTFGREYSCPSFGHRSVRQPVTIHAINGRIYHGTYFKSSGNYARVKLGKNG
jgi:hypothetical protein